LKTGLILKQHCYYTTLCSIIKPLSTNIGFLYHSASGQILLQKEPTGSLWTLIECKVGKILGAKALPVYDYTAAGKKCSIFYAKARSLAIPKSKKLVYSWFPIIKLAKIPVSAQTRQDLTVGHRVIDSATRRQAGERTVD